MNPRGRRILIGAGVVVGAWLIGPHLLRHVGFFRVRQIEMVGVRYSAPAAVIDALRLEPNASVFDDLDALAERLRALRGIADARVVRHLPGALKVIVREVEPVALVPGANGPLTTVDAAGHALPYDPSRVAVDLPVAASADSGLVALLALVQSMDPTLFEEITAARASRGDVVMQLGSRRLLVARDAGPEIIRAVVLVANDLQARSRSYGELDARYAGQIVVRRAAGGDGGGGGGT
ncbi:MAG TPA: FtsQ-type POTRA domain-containing protein [Gemmatimonadales bacterium]|nr:FtsQ-type POTRA domain-containing protein [Gemmatimonadales bacterium]